jgi:hypothetical protein
VLKRKTANGGWEEIDSAPLFSGPLDPEWRVFGRASADDKGPIMMMLAAIDALKAGGAQPAVNVKVILDSEEEKGSPSISKVMQAHRELLRSDAIVIHDGPMHATNRPTLVFGNRGAAEARLTVYGAKVPLHSGHYGNYAPNPAQRLANLLASMKNDEGRVTVAGYYDRVKIAEADRKIMAAVPDDEAALKRRLGIAKDRQGRRQLPGGDAVPLAERARHGRGVGGRQGGQHRARQGRGRTRPAHHARLRPGLPRPPDPEAHRAPGLPPGQGRTDATRSARATTRSPASPTRARAATRRARRSTRPSGSGPTRR